MGSDHKEVDLSLRHFIKNLGYITGGIALMGSMPWLSSCTTDKINEIKGEKARIGMIGTGSRGLYHIHNLLKMEHVQIVAVCDIYDPNLKQAQVLCPSAKTYTDYRKLLESKEIQGVIISSPLHWHAPMILNSLAAGKHVFCEKSMARTMDECRDIYDTYQQTENVLYFGMQRMFDMKYIKALQMIHAGTIGEIVGIRCHWFRNNDWRRPVSDPALEKQINWRLYRESSGGLTTELATHQLEVSNWALQCMPESVIGMGDIVYWKDGREVFDSISLTYHYNNGVKTTYESLIANKFNGMGEQILGDKGTMELAKGEYYFEDPEPAAGILQMINEAEKAVFDKIPIAGASWVPEIAGKQTPHYVIEGKIDVNHGLSMIGVDNDGSEELVSSFCQAVITGEKANNIVEECYSSTMLCLLGNQAMDEQKKIVFPEEYKIPYMKF